jgi:hydroxyacylglutathione hydrolase
MQALSVTILPAFSDNYMYLLEWGGEAVAVDPAEPGPVLNRLREQGLTLRAILNTHHHQDHVAGNEAVKAATGCRVIGPRDPRIPALDEPVGDGDEVEIGSLCFSVMGTPGHGRCDVSYVLASPPRPPILWCGDTLFVGGCGRLFEGTPAAMWDSLQKLAALPEETQVYCGHEYTVDNLAFALSVEPQNEAVRARLEEVKALRGRNEPTVPSTLFLEKQTNLFLRSPDVQSFAELRARKDRF